jgi:putative FmdB family regulatory protein
MPTYEYECSKCKKTFEAFQSMKDDAYKTCPKEKCCMKTWGKGKVKRLIGAGAGLIFKGSGFYITDYRSEGYKSAAESAKKSESTPPKPAESSSAPAKTDKAETSTPKAETKKTSAPESTKVRKSAPKK